MLDSHKLVERKTDLFTLNSILLFIYICVIHYIFIINGPENRLFYA